MLTMVVAYTLSPAILVKTSDLLEVVFLNL